MGGIIDGYVDFSTISPMLNIKLISSENEDLELAAIIDTGYNGEVIMSEDKIREIGLEFLGTIDSELANGQIVEIEIYRGKIKWFDAIREIAVGASQSKDTLLGTLLLSDCELNVNFKHGEVRIEELI